MKLVRLCCVAALLLATGTTVDASVKLNNAEIIGEWCWNDTDDGGPFHEKLANENCEGVLSIQKDGIELRYEEGGCTATAIKTWYDTTISPATKTPGGVLVSKIDMSCVGEGCTWRQQITVHFAKGVLFYKNNWHSRDKCKGN